MPRTLPFFGRGVAFPFRIDENNGGVVVTDGNRDSTSVALQYLNEKWTIREVTNEGVNHIAESIAHILLTRPTEHDTLPEFGSDIFTIIFEPNTEEFRLAASHYFSFSTERWEKRARIPEDGGTTWYFEGQLADQGILPVVVRIRFITEQVEGNLVSPLVTPNEARAQEYPIVNPDSTGHDSYSRYYGQRPLTRDGELYIRLRAPYNFSQRRDDIFYQVKPKDTWLLIAWSVYGDIRLWHYIALAYAYDKAADGGDRSYMDTTGDPPLGEVIRLPSKARVFTLATR